VVPHREGGSGGFAGPGDAAVHHQVLAGHETCAVAAQECAGVAEFGRVAIALGRHLLQPLRHDFFHRMTAFARVQRRRTAQAVGVERAGQQVVDGDVVLDGLARQTGNEARQAAAGAVGQA